MGSIVNRRRVYEKRMIPIEYLEADNPYTGDIRYVNCINTGYIPKSNNVRINTKIMWKDYALTLNTDWFGGYSFVDKKMHGIGIGPVKGNKTSLTINYNNYNQRNIYSVEQGGIYEIYLSSDICTINGQVISVTPPVTDGSENTAPIYLFRSSMTGNSGFASGFQGRFYYFQIYEGDQLVMDLIPVRIGTTGYMYDKVSGRLFRNGTTKGKFILGPDVK